MSEVGYTRIEDDPTDSDMVIVYYAYGTQNQVAVRWERASILTMSLPNAFIDFEPVAQPTTDPGEGSGR